MNISNQELKSFRAVLRQLEREIAEQMMKEIGCCGVSLSQCHILLEIENNGTLGVSGIAENLGLDKGNVSKTIESLVQRKFITRVDSPNDRRVVLLSLTKEGQNQVDRINSICNQYYQQVFDLPGAPDLKTVLEGVKFLTSSMKFLRNKKGDTDKKRNQGECKDFG